MKGETGLGHSTGQRSKEIGRHTSGLGFSFGHQASCRKVDESHIHGLHSVSLTGLHHSRDLVKFAFPNEVADGCGPNHNFYRRDPTAADSLFQQGLGEDTFERFRELRSNLRLLVRRKRVDNAVYGFWRAGCMQRGQHQMACFRSG